jgi:succinate dehydrogenase / fumarate reductase flavoprotein subunit
LTLSSKGRRFNYALEESLELQNMLKTAEAIVFSALQRKESRGAHYREDFPEETTPNGRNTPWFTQCQKG